ncbi:hypothetical protein TD95_002027 [Thielaviopsis punctulata]|uniref:LDB19 N-terminal domain-containing protein n=1 Tax=Thielaviopsis punctulata TaxID=72032 RepID=A0A0F4ZA87_9PEZI|nr:hypothetical protein TD95_002027 [Thielaviopsis punctulata]
MHCRVSNFFRSSTETFSAKARSLQIQRPKTQTLPNAREHQPSYDSSDSVVLESPSEAASHDSTSSVSAPNSRSSSPAKKNRLPFAFGRVSRKISPEPAAASLDWTIESPPAVLYGSAEDSTGALVSGLLHLTVHETDNCDGCGCASTELKRWTFFNEPKTLSQGVHEFPFSILIDGSLPASTDAPLVKISYDFKAQASVSLTQTSVAISTSPVKFERMLEVKRSLIRPDHLHRSLRVFPPTDIKADANYNQYIYPTATNTLSLRLEGVTVRNEATQTIEYWKLRRATWRLEETIKTTAYACEKHTPANGATESENAKTHVVRSDSRILGQKSATEGWKSDYNTENGRIDYEMEFGVLHSRHNKHNTVRYAGDVKTGEGVEITHCLMLELSVSREWAPMNRPELVSHTGTGRILRMRYPVFLTESPGLGISWDNEAPPMYQDVPASPPSYPQKTLALPPISYTELEEMGGFSHSGSSNVSLAGDIDSESEYHNSSLASSASSINGEEVLA